jgi:hypothetical protein
MQDDRAFAKSSNRSLEYTDVLTHTQASPVSKFFLAEQKHGRMSSESQESQYYHIIVLLSRSDGRGTEEETLA